MASTEFIKGHSAAKRQMGQILAVMASAEMWRKRELLLAAKHIVDAMGLPEYSAKGPDILAGDKK